MEDCQEIIDVLKVRFPEIKGPPKADICYATSNRQAAVRALAPKADLVLIVGDRESANSTRLSSIASEIGKPSHLISDASFIQNEWLNGVMTVLVSSGASVPETLVQDVVSRLQDHEPSEIEANSYADRGVWQGADRLQTGHRRRR